MERLVYAMLWLGLSACGPSLSPGGDGDGDGDGSGLMPTGSTGHDGADTSLGDTSGAVADESSGGSTVTEWCVVEQPLDDYDTDWLISIVDIDGDGTAELWRQPISGGRHRISRFGGFGGAEEILHEFELPDRYLFGDVDGDGLIDVLRRYSPTDGYWVRGDAGSGVDFEPRPLVAPPGASVWSQADFSGDGLADLVIGNGAYTDILTAVGDGTGVFTEVDSHNFDPAGGYPTADFFFFEGTPWLLVVHESCPGCSGRSWVLASIDGDGQILEHQRAELSGLGEVFGQLDRNGDGVPDVLVTMWPSGATERELAWLDSTEEGAFDVVPVPLPGEDVRAVDVDHDGFAELLSRLADDTYVLRRYEGAVLGVAEPVVGATDVRFTTYMGHGDLDGDGRTEYLDHVVTEAGGVVGDRVWGLHPCR